MSKETLLGKMDIWGGETDVLMGIEDLRRHIYLLGKTGSGKSTLLFNMLGQWVGDERGCGLIDPHGDLAEKLLDIIPSHKINDVCYFNPSDSEFPISFNPLADVPREKQALTAQAIVRALKGIWSDSWGPRMENILRNALQALMDTNNPSFLSLQKMLSEPSYRDAVVKQIKDPVIRSFWVNEFNQWDKRLQKEAVSPIQNKVGQLLNDPIMRNVLSQNKSKFNLERLMDEQKIIIINLSKGAIGAESANLLGSLLVAFFGESAMGRSVRGNSDRDFHLVIDEFHNFMTDAFEPMLSEVRKYGLSFVLSHQYGAQLKEGIRDAVLGNVGSFITFTIGGQDATYFAQEYGHPWSASRIAGVRRYQAIMRILVAGELLSPRVIRSLPPTQKDRGNREAIINQSRRRYGTKRSKVENKIEKWFESS